MYAFASFFKVFFLDSDLFGKNVFKFLVIMNSEEEKRSGVKILKTDKFNTVKILKTEFKVCLTKQFIRNKMMRKQ